MPIKQSVPPGVVLIEAVTKRLEGKEPYFIPGSSSYRAWETFIEDTIDVIEDPRFLKTTDFQDLLYVHLLTLLSHHEGLLSSGFKKAILSKGDLSLSWRDQDELCIAKQGVDEPVLLRLLEILFGKDMAEGVLDRVFFQEVLRSHKRNLSSILDAKRLLLEAKRIVTVARKQDKPDDLVIFTLLSAFPLDELNSFYLKLSHYYDRDLMVNQSIRTPVNIHQFFNTTSQDIVFVLEKIRLHYNLVHYAVDLEDKQKKIFSDMWHYLVERIQNQEVRPFVLKQLDESFQLQFLPRIQLCELLIRQLSFLGT